MTRPSEEDDNESMRTIDRPPSSASIPPSKAYHPYSPAVLALLMSSSLLGLLARLGIQALTTYDGQSIFPLAYVQVIGCLIMGICFPLKDSIGHFYAPLYTALTTGFCGSLTTFSAWQHDIFISWLNPHHFSHHKFQSFIDGVGKAAFTLALSVSSIRMGRRIGHRLIPAFDLLPFPSKSLRYGLNIISISLFLACIPAYLFMSPSFRHQATAALLFAFPGALGRYLLSVHLNSLRSPFPIGTLTANVVGTALLGAFSVLQGRPVNSHACDLLQGLQDGFCGCLTTVSTFALEITGLRPRYAILYISASWGISQLMLLLILGPSFWLAGISENILCSYSQ